MISQVEASEVAMQKETEKQRAEKENTCSRERGGRAERGEWGFNAERERPAPGLGRVEDRVCWPRPFTENPKVRSALVKWASGACPRSEVYLSSHSLLYLLSLRVK